jgi:hypothetical protein
MQQQILLAQRAHRDRDRTCVSPPLLDVAACGAPIRLVLADASSIPNPIINTFGNV